MASRILCIDKGASGSSSGTSGAIAIIAAGVRKGGFDALSDFYQSMKNLNKSGGGITSASYETGDGAGGRGDGSGGYGAGRGRTGASGLPDSPAGKSAMRSAMGGVARQGAVAVLKRRRVFHTRPATSRRRWGSRQSNIGRSRPVSPRSRAAHTVKWAAQAAGSRVGTNLAVRRSERRPSNWASRRRQLNSSCPIRRCRNDLWRRIPPSIIESNARAKIPSAVANRKA